MIEFSNITLLADLDKCTFHEALRAKSFVGIGSSQKGKRAI